MPVWAPALAAGMPPAARSLGGASGTTAPRSHRDGAVAVGCRATGELRGLLDLNHTVSADHRGARVHTLAFLRSCRARAPANALSLTLGNMAHVQHILTSPTGGGYR